MIEVEGKLCRRSVYFAGESVKCKVIFRNIPNKFNQREMRYTSQSKKSQTIAWASAQIVCVCNSSSSRVAVPESLNLRSLGAISGTAVPETTALTPYTVENGYCVFETDLKILICDLKLAPGESKEVFFNDLIPKDAYPSYKGASVKYCYKVMVAMQRVGAPVRVLRIPFRVFVLYGVSNFELEKAPAQASIFIPSPQPTNLIDIASEVLSNITSRKVPHDYKISSAAGPIAVFRLLKSSVRLGEDIVGLFDFTHGAVQCVQFTVHLQSEEDISEECRQRRDQKSADTSFEKQTQFCLFQKKTHIAVPVPLHCSPGFLTEIVGLRWWLCFEFAVLKGSMKKIKLGTQEGDAVMKQGPVMLETDIVTWRVPIRILPTMPTQVETGGSSLTACRLLL